MDNVEHQRPIARYKFRFITIVKDQMVMISCCHCIISYKELFYSNRNGSSSVMVTSGLTSDQLKERIRLHQTPPELCRSSSVRRSKSTTAISNNREINALEQAKLS